jgi:hypothetical protein
LNPHGIAAIGGVNLTGREGLFSVIGGSAVRSYSTLAGKLILGKDKLRAVRSSKR